MNLFANAEKTIDAILADPSIFEKLAHHEMKRVHQFVKDLRPMPEMKDDFTWCLELMKENIAASKGTVAKSIEKAAKGDERLSKIVALKKEGLTLRQIGEQLGLSGPRISGILRGV